LFDVFEQIKAGGAKSSKTKGMLEIGVDTLPKLPMTRAIATARAPSPSPQPLRIPRRRRGSIDRGPDHRREHAVAESVDYIPPSSKRRSRRRSR